MSAHQDDLTAARERIAAAYDPRLLEDAGHRLADLLAAHLTRVQRSEGPVLPWVDPPEAIRDAAAILQGSDPSQNGSTSGSTTAEDFSRLVQIMLDRGLNLHDPRYIGHQVPAPVPLAGLFDAVGSVTNQCMAIYEMGPWATAVERALVAEVGQAVGWAPDTFAGAITHGGSLGESHGPTHGPQRRPERLVGSRTRLGRAPPRGTRQTGTPGCATQTRAGPRRTGI